MCVVEAKSLCHTTRSQANTEEPAGMFGALVGKEHVGSSKQERDLPVELWAPACLGKTGCTNRDKEVIICEKDRQTAPSLERGT